LRFWAHTASARRTSGNDCGSWPTPTTRDHKDTGDLSGSMYRKDGKLRDDTVPRVAWLAGWTTPQAHDTSGRSKTQKEIHGTKHGCACLVRDADLACWPTPSCNNDRTGNPQSALSMKREDGS